MNWPDHFPPGCPPEAAEVTHGVVFRLVEHEHPKERDFISYFLAKPNETWKNPCKACGLSVYTVLEDVLRLKRRVPATRRKWIAKENLQEQDGRFMHTPTNGDSHHSWWMPNDIDPWNRFTAYLNPEGNPV